MLRLPDHWLWDFWFAHADGRYHVFYLQAPRSLGNADLRHANASVGHAVSEDLLSWEVLPDALAKGQPGAWDDRATWTGSVLEHDSEWVMHYTGTSEAEGGLVQRIGRATSSDLATWHKHPDPVVTADPRWYEQLDLDVWIDETCRDPWVFADPGGDGFHMYFTARVRTGPPDARGVVGTARSSDLLTWEVGPPVTEPGDFGHLEVPQVVEIGGRHYLVFSVYEWAHSAARLERSAAVAGTHYLLGDSPLGPFRSLTDDFLIGTPAGAFYAGRMVRGPGGDWVFLAWAQFDDDGGFVGALSDPVAVLQDPDGTLRLAGTPRLGATGSLSTKIRSADRR